METILTMFWNDRRGWTKLLTAMFIFSEEVYRNAPFLKKKIKSYSKLNKVLNF